MALGKKTGGRQKGTRNKRNQVLVDVRARLDELGCDPIEGMAVIALQHVACPTCGGSKRAKFGKGLAGYYPDPDEGDMMTCRTCLGSGYEPMSAELRGRMWSELAQYIAPKRKSTEISGPDGEPLLPGEMSDVSRSLLEELVTALRRRAPMLEDQRE